MSVPVLPYIPSMGVQHTIVREFVPNTFADGYKTFKTKETAFLRANGIGGISSYKGLNKFTIKFNRMLVGANKLADNLYNFMMARLDNLNEAFYFYNPTERATPDLTGADPIGRYHVHFENPNSVLNRDLFRVCCFSHSGIVLLEHKELGTSGDVINAMDPIIWHSCPIGLTVANLGTTNDLWFITSIDGGFDAYHVGNNNGPDALYIMKYDFTTATWSYVYLKISTSLQEWAEPDIDIFSKGDITVLVLAHSITPRRIQFYVFKDNVLLNFYEDSTHLLTPYHITPNSLLIDSSGYIHFAALNASSQLCDLCSKDNGISWSSNVIAAGDSTYNNYLFFTEIGTTLFAFMLTSAYTISDIYQSVNSGTTWTHVSTPTLPHYNPYAFKSWKGNLYLLTYDQSGGSNGLAVYKSIDNGATFTKYSIEPYIIGQEKGFSAATLFYSDDNYIFAIGRYLDWTDDKYKIRCYRSSDGETWTLRSTQEPDAGGSGFKDPFIAVKNGSRIYFTAYYPIVPGFFAGTWQLAFLYSDDDGATWNIVRTPFYDVTTYDTDPRGLNLSDYFYGYPGYPSYVKDKIYKTLTGEELKDELYGYYKFEEVTGLDDRINSTGLGKPLKNTTIYPFTQAVGKVGYCNRFIKISGSIKVETLSALINLYQSPFTIAFWASNPDPNLGGYFNGSPFYISFVGSSLLSYVKNPGGGGPNVGIGFNNYNGASRGPFWGHTDLSDNLHFWCVSCDGTNLYFECDNVQIGEVLGVGAPNQNTGLLSITGLYSFGIDELGIWARYLSSSERSQLWNSGNGMSVY